MMLVTLAVLLCTFVAPALSQGQCNGSGPCRCVPAGNQGACDGTASAVGTDVTVGATSGCQTAGGVIACDNNGLTVPNGDFCCNTPPTPSPPCVPALGSFTTVVGALRCNGDTQGEFVINSISAGTSPVKVVVDNGITPPTTFTNVIVGVPGTGTIVRGLAQGSNNKVTVTNAEGCSKEQFVTATGPIAITLPDTSGIINVTSPFCRGGVGRIRLVPATGGTPPYSYSSDGGVTFPTQDIVFSGLLPGVTFNFVAKDTTGCISNVITKTLTQPATAVSFASLVAIPPACGPTSGSGLSVLGSITATGTGGTTGGFGPYQFSLDGGAFQNSGAFSGVSAGAHTVTVRDGLGCSAQQTVTVAATADIATPTFAFTPPTLPCNGSFTTLAVTTCCGNSYQIDGVNGASRIVQGPAHTITVTNGACSKTFPAVAAVAPVAVAGAGLACDDNIASTLNDVCVGQFCVGGCPATAASCPTGKIGIQLETDLLLCADKTAPTQYYGKKVTLANWAFYTSAGTTTTDPLNPDRISLTELNSLFVGLATVGNQAKSYAFPNDATIQFDTAHCFVRFEKLDRKRTYLVAPQFNTATLGGTPSL